ncbi:hypothetical protein [Terrimonas alba]|uniref:hypothetical protein n=1 Tax=Terrimonas alba TaxID=3349636 RepID=UPI0035F2545D
MNNVEQQISQIRHEIILEKLYIRSAISKGKIFDEVKKMTQRVKELEEKISLLLQTRGITSMAMLQ